MAYEYDLFVSYNRSFEREGRRVETQAGGWVKRVFYPALASWWHASSPSAGPVFFDEESIPKGSRWPDYLARAHRASRCLVPVWYPPYFSSRWCEAEWLSMVEREQRFNVDTSNGHGLVVPVIFYDGDTFPQPAKDRQGFKCHNLAYLNSAEGDAPELPRLRQWFAEELIPALKGAVDRAPDWDPSFPLLDPATEDGADAAIELPGMGH